MENTPDNVNELRATKKRLLEAFNLHLLKAGQTQAELARIARVSPQTINQVVVGSSDNQAAIGIIKSMLPAFFHDFMQLR